MGHEAKRQMKEKEFKILRNKRPEANIFKNENNCSFCNNFVPQVIMIPTESIPICKTCLNTMIEALDKNMRNHFESDFQERDNA